MSESILDAYNNLHDDVHGAQVSINKGIVMLDVFKKPGVSIEITCRVPGGMDRGYSVDYDVPRTPDSLELIQKLLMTTMASTDVKLKQDRILLGKVNAVISQELGCANG